MYLPIGHHVLTSDPPQQPGTADPVNQPDMPLVGDDFP